jgi:ferritin-like metal-binding protein YciE
VQKTIKDLFIDELHDILSSEEQIVKALPKVAEAAESEELKKAFKDHLQETKGQIQRLNSVFKLLKLERKTKFCKGTRGLIEECNEVIKEFTKSPVRDAALISKAQRIEHYEISAYGTMCTFAKELGHKEIARILHDTLLEEGHADKKLTKIAEGGFLSTGINHEANIAQVPVKRSPARKPAVKATKAKSAVKKPAAKGSVVKKVASKVTAVKKAAVKTVKKDVKKLKHALSR